MRMIGEQIRRFSGDGHEVDVSRMYLLGIAEAFSEWRK
jgi:hypothetical protein